MQKDKKGKDYKEIASSILDCTLASYYNWANQSRPIIRFLEKYLTKEDLQQFLQSGSIKKLDLLDTVLNSQSQNYLHFYNSLGNNVFDSPQKLLYFKSLNFEGSTLLVLKKLNVGDFESDYELLLPHYLSANVDSYINTNKPNFEFFYDYCDSNGLGAITLFHQIEILLSAKLGVDKKELTKQAIELRKDLVNYSSYTRYSPPSAGVVEAMDDLEKELAWLKIS